MKKIIESIPYEDGWTVKVRNIECITIGDIFSVKAPAILYDADRNVIGETVVYTEFTVSDGELCVC